MKRKAVVEAEKRNAYQRAMGERTYVEMADLLTAELKRQGNALARVSAPTVRNWCLGRNHPRMEYLRAWAAVTGTKVEDYA